MMTPELKQDLDVVMAELAQEVAAVHEEHGVPMGELTVSIDYDEPECECECDCEDEGFAEPALITTLEEFDVVVREIAADFEAAILEAKEEFIAALAGVDDCVDRERLDETLMSVVAAQRMAEMGSKLEAAFQV